MQTISLYWTCKRLTRRQQTPILNLRCKLAVKKAALNLTHLKQGETGILDRLDLPDDDARRLMEMGFLPGHPITPAHAAPGGDPRVFRVDGSEVALRRETANI